ncbi:hypothetical protein EXW35_28335 (plasmid) [Bacillus mycoides]|nr:hypothetical protein EXW35_28335 [Bacillus mycoides]
MGGLLYFLLNMSFFLKCWRSPIAINLIGVPPAFRKKTTLRAYKILYSFSANPVTNEKPKIAP